MVGQGHQTTEGGPEIIQSNPSSLESRDEPNTEGAAARSSTSQLHLFQHQASLLSRGQDISIIYNEGNITLDASDLGAKKFAICNAPGGQMEIRSKDPSTPSQNLGLIAPGKSPSQTDLTTDVPRSHDNQEAPRMTAANSHPPIPLTPDIPHGHEERPKASSRPLQTTPPEDPCTVPASPEPTPIGHKCKYCNKSFETRQAMRSHESKNPIRINFKNWAGICQCCFPSTKERDRHIKEYHTTCYSCSRKFDALAHLKNHSKKRQAMCSFCPQQLFCTEKDYVTHVKQKHVWCELCDGYSESTAKLEEHKRCKHTYCDECKPCENDNYSEHYSALHGECHLCNTRHSSPFLLKQHTDSHPKCSFCPASGPFANQFMLDTHTLENHPACTWCHSGAFPSQRKLDSHLKKKHPLCDEDGCGERCMNQKRLTEHKADVHPRCDLCPAFKPPFPSKQARDSHRQDRRQHPECKICYGRFRDSRDLEKHQRDAHPICKFYDHEKPFYSPGELYDHQRRRHYVCKMCVHGAFEYKDELEQHKLDYHGYHMVHRDRYSSNSDWSY